LHSLSYVTNFGTSLQIKSARLRERMWPVFSSRMWSLSPACYPSLFSFLYFLVVLRFELRASLLLGRWSTTWATPQKPYFVLVFFFQDGVSWAICPGLVLNPDPPDLCLSRN
jgi:hypothetical protein